ncbi:MAG: NAD(P)/FAD-dependent oxidoreductase, partial [Bryobacteraceae bacterium]
MSDFDVVVVGAGPGGLAAGCAAARAGCSVLILEQGHEIGSPTRTTGGSFVQDLRDLDIPSRLYHPIRRCRFVSPRNSAAFDYGQPALCVIDVRGVFQFLAERAAEAGAKIRMGAAAIEPILENEFTAGVKTKTRTGADLTIRSKILIDATGYRAAMLKQAGLHPGFYRFGVGSEYDLYAPHCNEDEAVLIVGRQIAPAGYAWVFPWGRKRVRVGVGIIHGDSKEHPDQYLDGFVERSAQFGVNLAGAQPIEYHYGLIPSDGLAKVFTGNGIMGVGDAAGQSSALAGEGIRWAIKAGRMAGAVAGKAIAARDVSQ